MFLQFLVSRESPADVVYKGDFIYTICKLFRFNYHVPRHPVILSEYKSGVSNQLQKRIEFDSIAILKWWAQEA